MLDINKMLGKKSFPAHKKFEKTLVPKFENNFAHRRISDSPNVLSKNNTQENNNTKFTDMKLSTLFGKNPVSTFIGKVTKKPVDNLLRRRYDQSELKKGIKKEMEEHSMSPEAAEKTAKNHLDEIPDYYSRLEKMEFEATLGF